jgi:ribosome maturation factor RimP
MSLLDEPKMAQLREIVEAVVKDNFLELFDFRTRPQGKKLVLTVAIDKKSGPVTLNECAAVSQDVEKKLDDMDLIETSYLLEVTSPGLDRPLRHLDDCRRFKGRLARFVLREPLDGQVTLEGRLGDVNEEKVELLLNQGRVLWVSFPAVKTARLVVEI